MSYKDIEIRPEYLLIPYQLIDDKDVKPTESRVYGVIYFFSMLKRGKCIASNPTIARVAKCSTGTARNAISKLAKLGYIKCVYDGGGKKDRLEIIPLVVFGRVSLDDDKVSSDNDTGVIRRLHGVSSDNEQSNNKGVLIEVLKEEYTAETNSAVPGSIVEAVQETNPVIDKLGDTWNQWVVYRKELRKPLKASTIKLQVDFLSKQPDPHACIEQSIRNGWTGLFPAKGEKTTKRHSIKSI